MSLNISFLLQHLSLSCCLCFKPPNYNTCADLKGGGGYFRKGGKSPVSLPSCMNPCYLKAAGTRIFEIGQEISKLLCGQVMRINYSIVILKAEDEHATSESCVTPIIV